MDEVFSALFAVGLVLFILVGPWILLWRSSLKRKRERQEDQQRWDDLTNRVFVLEQNLQRAAQTPLEPQTEVPAASVIASPKAPIQSAQPAPGPTPVPFFPAPPTSPAQSTTESWVKRGSLEPPQGRPFERPPAAPPTTPSPPPTPPQFAPAASGPSFSNRFKPSLDLEETLGTNWLNKIGISILVLGIAFFLAYQMKRLGPPGKVLVGYVVSSVLLGAGIWLERNNRYRILARAGIGGGWALAFFTTYAMYHVTAAQVLQSQLTDLALMLCVAALMVWHTLRYRSQVVTGLAFLLAFLTVTISHSNVYSLSAGGVLALGMVVIVSRMQWFELELFGILASYLNHYLWLRPIIEPMQRHHHPFPEFLPSAGILALYWLIFRLSYVFRQPPDGAKERISTAAALLNTSLLLLLFKYQSVHPEWAFWALLVIGGAEILLGQLPVTRRRRTAVIVLSTLGVVLLVAAFPFRYSGTRLSVLWLLEAEALLLIGVWTREIIFRRLGAIATVVVSVQLIGVDAAHICGIRMDGADLSSQWREAILFAVASAVFYGNSHWALPRWPELFVKEFDCRLMQRLSYAGAVMALIGLWAASPEAWTAVAWCTLVLVLALAARRFALRELHYQANALAALAFVRVLAINLEATSTFHGLTQRLISISLVAALLYVSSRWSSAERSDETPPSERQFASFVAGAMYTWGASFLLGLLAWYELRPVGVAVAWAVGGLLLLEVGLERKSPALRLQAYVALLAAFLRIFFVNLNAAGAPGEISPRFYSVIPIALGFFYAYWRLGEAREILLPVERKIRPAECACWLGVISIASLMRFELPADWVAAGWAALAFALLAIAWRSERRIFLHQAILVSFGVLFRTLLHNFYQRTYFPAPPWESRWLCVGTSVALLFVSMPILFQLRRKESDPRRAGKLVTFLRALARRPEQVFFFISVLLLTVLLTLEMRHGMVTLSWGAEGLGIFLFALWVGERSFRLTSLGLLLLCVGKILLVDVWRLQPTDRYLTLIALGASLLLVSFLYTRHREAIRQYL